MEFPEGSQSQGGNLRWKPTWSKFFIKYMVEEVKKGNKVDQKFKGVAATNAARAVSQEFNIMITEKHVHNHFRTLKGRFKHIKKLTSKTGLGWNEELRMFCVPDHEYHDYIRDNPKDEPYINKPIEDYDDLALICGDAQAIGYGAKSANEPLGVNPNTVNDNTPDIVVDSQPMFEDMETGDTSQAPPAPSAPQGGTPSGSRRSRGSRATKRTFNEDIAIETMQEMAANLGEVAKSMRVVQEEEVSITYNCWTEIMKLDEFTEEEQALVYDYLLDNIRKARGFLGKTPDQRAVWMRQYLRRSGL